MQGNILCWSLALLTVAGGAIAQTGESEVAKLALGERLTTYNAPVVPSALEEPVGDLRLRDALAVALMHNPRLGSFSWAVRATEAAQLQAGVWPNSKIGIELENFSGSGAFQGLDAAEATLALSQLVLLGGKRSKRTEVARLDNVIASWDYEAARIQTYAATAGAFVNLLAAQEQLALTERIVEVARGVEAAVSARVRAGGTLALEENRARVAIEGSLIEKNLAEREVTIARRELAAMWGSNAPEFAQAVGALDAVGSAMPDLESLLDRVEQNPDVARWTTELDRRRARISVIQADRVPDLNIAAGIRYDNAVDDVGFVLALSTPLPMWNRQKGAIREAEYLVRQATEARRAVETTIRRDIAIAFEVLAGAHDEVTRLRDRVLPEAEKAASTSEDAYHSGAIQLTDVLDIQRTFFRLRVRYVNALARYHGAVAKLEGLIGAPIAGAPQLDVPTEGREGD